MGVATHNNVVTSFATSLSFIILNEEKRGKIMAYNRKTNIYEGYIYEIYNDTNNIKYIGQTRRSIAIRFSGHKKDYLDKQCALYAAMRKIGIEHFHVKQVEKVYSNTLNKIKDILNKREMFWIQHYKKNNIALYNMTNGGNDVSKQYRPHSVIQYDLFCNILNYYESITDASEKTGVSRGDIVACCLKNNKILRAGNYIWRYIEEPLNDKEMAKLHKKYKGICQYDFNGNLLNTFYTVKEAQIYLSENYNLKGLNIYNCAYGTATSADGYIWRFKDDSFDKYHIPKQIKRVEQHDLLTGELINIFTDCVEASKRTNCNKSGINSCCNGRFKQCGGYTWCFENEYKPLKIRQKEKSVNRYDLNNNYIDSYNSIIEASKALNINRNLIGAVCNNKKTQAGGYIWRFNVNTY